MRKPPVQPEGVERRLMAILAADVAGYSRLMAADETGTHARLSALRREFWPPALPEHEPPLPDKPSLAVLPFDNMSADADDQYFADGLTDDLVTAAPRSPACS